MVTVLVLNIPVLECCFRGADEGEVRAWWLFSL